jgi:hypothetical protein
LDLASLNETSINAFSMRKPLAKGERTLRKTRRLARPAALPSGLPLVVQAAQWWVRLAKARQSARQAALLQA